MMVGETAMASALAKPESEPSCNSFAKCRRADNMTFGMENDRRQCAGLWRNSKSGYMHRHLFRSVRWMNDSTVDFAVIAEVATGHRNTSTCKLFAKCRRADIFQKWKMGFGVAA
jgi:hypothetical protein